MEKLLGHNFDSSISCGRQTDTGGRPPSLAQGRSSASTYLPAHYLSPWVLLKTSNRITDSHYCSLAFPRATPTFSRWDINGDPSGPRARARPREVDYGDEAWEEERWGGGVGRKRRKRRWWSGEPPFEEEEEEEAGIWEEAIDSFWMLKVFKTYGWMLPPILISWVLATGPKAFLMAMALPLGQSAVTFAFKKLWDAVTGQTKSKTRKRKRSYASSVSDSTPGMDVQEQQRRASAKEKKSSRFGGANGNGAAQKVKRDVSDFGGWDILDSMETKQPPQGQDRSSKAPPAGSKLSSATRQRDAPLLLRLLVAVFPFLGYLSKIL